MNVLKSLNDSLSLVILEFKFLKYTAIKFCFLFVGHRNENTENTPSYHEINELYHQQQRQQSQQEYSITVKILNEKGNKLLVQGCHHRNDTFTFLASGVLKNLSEKIIVLQIKYEDDHVELNIDEQKILTEIFLKKDIVVVQSVSNSHETAIYWKTKKIRHLLTVSKINDISLNEAKKLYVFIEEFLVQSLEKDHSGKHLFLIT